VCVSLPAQSIPRSPCPNRRLSPLCDGMAGTLWRAWEGAHSWASQIAVAPLLLVKYQLNQYDERAQVIAEASIYVIEKARNSGEIPRGGGGIAVPATRWHAALRTISLSSAHTCGRWMGLAKQSSWDSPTPPLERGACHSVPSPVAPEARLRHDVGEGQGGGDCRTSKVGSPPTPNPSPQGAHKGEGDPVGAWSGHDGDASCHHCREQAGRRCRPALVLTGSVARPGARRPSDRSWRSTSIRAPISRPPCWH
jgi:hypothetical protein